MSQKDHKDISNCKISRHLFKFPFKHLIYMQYVQLFHSTKTHNIPITSDHKIMLVTKFRGKNKNYRHEHVT